MLVISNNCCGGRLYQKLDTKFNNPFIWMVSPYHSIHYTMLNFDNVDWYNYTFEKSKLRENTYIVKVVDEIELHYVHYKFDPNAKNIYQEKKFDREEKWTGDVYYCKIWEFINEKYIERVERMLALKENPSFLLRDETFANQNSKISMRDIAYCDSPYKRVIITRDQKIDRNDDICKTIHVKDIEMPEPTVRHNLDEIKGFLAI